MAAPKKGRRPAGAQGRPGRALALILIAMVALTGGMFWAGQLTPRLGIDLAGGTTHHAQGQERARQAGRDQRDQHEHRGRHHRAPCQRSGCLRGRGPDAGRDNIIVNIPKGTNYQQAREQVGTTAQLYFRPVLTVAAGTPTVPAAHPERLGVRQGARRQAPRRARQTANPPSGHPSATPTTQGRAVTDALKAADADPVAPPSGKPSGRRRRRPRASGRHRGRRQAAEEVPGAGLHEQEARVAAGENVKPSDPTVACGKNSEGQWEKYVLGPAEVNGKDVDDAKASIDQRRGQWIVRWTSPTVAPRSSQKITARAVAAAAADEPVRHRARRRSGLRALGAHDAERATPRSPAASPSSPPRTWATSCRTARCRSPSRSRASPPSPPRSAASSSRRA